MSDYNQERKSPGCCLDSRRHFNSKNRKHIFSRHNAPPCKRIRIPESGNFFLWNPESWVLESGIQHKESGIPLTIGIRNPMFHLQMLEFSTWNPESMAWNPAQDCVRFPYVGRQRRIRAKKETCDEAEAVNLCDKKTPTYTHASPEAKWNWCIRVRASLFRVQPTFRFKFKRIWEDFFWVSRQIIGVSNRGLKKGSHKSWIEG